MAKIKDLGTYTSCMKKSMLDKLWFTDKIEEPECIVDYGCADASLLKEISNYFHNTSFVGIDISDEMLQIADSNFSEAVYCKPSEYSEVNNKNNTVLNISSVIHEVYSYCSNNEINEFWDFVFNSGFSYIAIRDMMISNVSFRTSDIYDKAKVLQTASQHQLYDFTSIWGDIGYLPNLIHWLLKYKYTANWEREVKENYLPLTIEQMIKLIPKDMYEIHYLEHYTLPYLKKTVKEDYDIELKEYTHAKILLKKR